MPLEKRKLSLNKAVSKVNSNESLTTSELRSKYRVLRKQNAELDKQIAELKAQGLTEDLQSEMQALHEYNDIKDITQMVLGHLAEAENCTVAYLHKKYSLPLD